MSSNFGPKLKLIFRNIRQFGLRHCGVGLGSCTDLGLKFRVKGPEPFKLSTAGAGVDGFQYLEGWLGASSHDDYGR